MLVDAKPPVNDDVVYIHAAVEGVKAGMPFRQNHVRAYKPIDISGRTWRAISWTTAASAVSVVELVAEGSLQDSGFIKQEDITLDALFSTQAGRHFEKQGKV
ncbi:hypothetical protein [Aeromicrobium sp. UC242_57]|uniref:hypothetical protein n=1 Tax=Aeromicrobium sp. UC242_57 TaxID=3374624 RepID=UPI0037944136